MLTWPPIYQELAKALLPFRDRQPELVRILDEIKQSGVPIIRLINSTGEVAAPVQSAPSKH